jgi:hypothetical protein
VPNAPGENLEDIDSGMLMIAPPEEAAAVDAFRQLRNQLFPNWYAAQSYYFEQPDKAAKARVLKQFPWLPDYWDWSRAQKATNPVIGKYAVEPEEKVNVPYDLSFVKEFTPAMSRGLLGYYYANEPLSQGALSELRFIWTQYNQPGGDFESFVNEVLPMALAP